MKRAKIIADGNGWTYIYNPIQLLDAIRFYHPKRKVWLDGVYYKQEKKARCTIRYSFDGICNEIVIPLANVVGR